MSNGGWAMLAVTLVVLGTLLFLIAATVRSVQSQRTRGCSV
jgi:hypothetical protein